MQPPTTCGHATPYKQFNLIFFYHIDFSSKDDNFHLLLSTYCSFYSSYVSRSIAREYMSFLSALSWYMKIKTATYQFLPIHPLWRTLDDVESRDDGVFLIICFFYQQMYPMYPICTVRVDYLTPLEIVKRLYFGLRCYIIL